MIDTNALNLRVEPIHPRDFVRRYGRQIAIDNGYPEDTLKNYTSHETSSRYRKPREAVLNHLGLLSMLIEGKLQLIDSQKLQ